MNKKLLSALSLLILILSCSEDNGIGKAFQEKRYESAGHVTDPRDGQTYRTVKIGNVTWTAENLNYKTDESWCYGGVQGNCEKYGRLYSWKDAAMKACPPGWRLPEDDGGWYDLMVEVGDSSRLLRDKGWGGADRHGFSALAGGWRNVAGAFFELGSYANWWSLTERSLDSARYWEIAGDTADKFYGELYYGSVRKAYGMSVRCVEGAANLVFVTFNPNNGVDAPFTLAVVRGQNLSNWDLTVSGRGGFVFTGWFTDEAEEYNPNAPVTQNMAFRGNWRPVPKYTVSFDLAGGNGGATWLGSVRVDSGAAIGATRMPGNPTKADSVFAGWFDGEAQYGSSTVIHKDVTLAARWAVGFIDSRDNKTYKTVKIGAQTWMAENLNYSSGNSWCYSNSDGYCANYGRLYTWAAAMANASSSSASPSGVKGVCPAGWHLPSSDEWAALVNAAGGVAVAGKRLKANSDLWSASGKGVDAYGFSALPGGRRNDNGAFFEGGSFAYWWTTTNFIVYEATHAYTWGMNAYADSIFIGGPFSSPKTFGQSVRCVKD
jgi:uncharacterized protein (TIGR02145 family)